MCMVGKAFGTSSLAAVLLMPSDQLVVNSTTLGPTLMPVERTSQEHFRSLGEMHLEVSDQML